MKVSRGPRLPRLALAPLRSPQARCLAASQGVWTPASFTADFGLFLPADSPPEPPPVTLAPGALGSFPVRFSFPSLLVLDV